MLEIMEGFRCRGGELRNGPLSGREFSRPGQWAFRYCSRREAAPGGASLAPSHPAAFRKLRLRMRDEFPNGLGPPFARGGLPFLGGGGRGGGQNRPMANTPSSPGGQLVEQFLFV